MGTLKPYDAKAYKQFYNSRFNSYGYDPRSLGWVLGSQQVRFEALTAIGELDGCSILDVGCGFGDLYGYLLANNIKVDYTGVDLNRKFIEIARKVYPGAEFIVADFEDDRIPGKFDWSFESGIFNLRIGDNRSFIRNTLEKMYKMSKKGLAADFLSAGAAFKNSTLYYQSPLELAEFCHMLTGQCIIKSDYRPAEFCIYLYKDSLME